MKTINVNKKELLSTLKKNRKIHIEEYKEAIAAYHTAIVAELSTMLIDARGAEIGSVVKTRAELQRPDNYVKSYDKAIQMLEWEESDLISLDHQEFAKYVEDEWAWSDSFKMLNSTYSM